MVYFQEPKIAWKPLGFLLQQNHAKKNQGENLKAIQILIPSRCPNLIPNSLPEIQSYIPHRKLSVQDICVL